MMDECIDDYKVLVRQAGLVVWRSLRPMLS